MIDWVLRVYYGGVLIGMSCLLLMAPWWTLGLIAFYIGLCWLMEPPRP